MLSVKIVSTLIEPGHIPVRSNAVVRYFTHIIPVGFLCLADSGHNTSLLTGVNAAQWFRHIQGHHKTITLNQVVAGDLPTAHTRLSICF